MTKQYYIFSQKNSIFCEYNAMLTNISFILSDLRVLYRQMNEIENITTEILHLESLLNQKKNRLEILLREKNTPIVDNHSPPFDKINLYRSLFKGREDVYAIRFESKLTGKSGYQPACSNEWKKGICEKPKVKCSDCTQKNFKTITDKTISCHLTGYFSTKNKEGQAKPFIMGLYPMRTDETCSFLAIDFDKKDWEKDTQSFLESCDEYKVPAYLERSRSGKGGHIWIFFSEPVKAYKARKLGSALIAAALDRRPEIGFDSFDRFFPNQDTLPKGGFGNLIALPLQKAARKKGNTCFLDDSFEPYSDQWLFLSTVTKLSDQIIDDLLTNHLPHESFLSISPSDQFEEKGDFYPVIPDPLPKKLSITLSSQIFIDSKGLPPP